ncbi:MAG TPA: HAMP domain-containing sensor histidine kinase, partial [Balneolaceae bacterium]|nr:HAMP domain-containing sensor histidine kinase [Balneolaceae bacterium]
RDFNFNIPSNHSEKNRSGNARKERLASLLEQLLEKTGARGGMLLFLESNNIESIRLGKIQSGLQLTSRQKQLLAAGTPFMQGQIYLHPVYLREHLSGAICININKKTWKTLHEDLVEAYALLVARNIEITNKKKTFSGRDHLLQGKKNELEKIQQYNQNLLSIITHDLTSPLNAVSGYLEMIEKCLADKQARHKLEEYYKHIQMGVSDVFEMLKQLNEVVNLRKGSLTLNNERFDANSIVQKVGELLRATAENKEVKLQIHPAESPAFIEADAVKFKRIIYNLISNAIKYTPGRQHIFVSLKECADTVKIQIKDEGKGITKDKIEAIFEPFTKFDSGEKDLFSHGLGLYISSYLVKLMDGSISVESKPGKGSTFVLAMPRTGRAYQNKSA